MEWNHTATWRVGNLRAVIFPTLRMTQSNTLEIVRSAMKTKDWYQQERSQTKIPTVISFIENKSRDCGRVLKGKRKTLHCYDVHQAQDWYLGKYRLLFKDEESTMFQGDQAFTYTNLSFETNLPTLVHHPTFNNCTWCGWEQICTSAYFWPHHKDALAF